MIYCIRVYIDAAYKSYSESAGTSEVAKPVLTEEDLDKIYEDLRKQGIVPPETALTEFMKEMQSDFE